MWDIQLSIDHLVCLAVIRSVLLNNSETSLSRWVMRRLLVFENHWRRIIGSIWWHYFVSNSEGGHKSWGPGVPLLDVLNRNRLRWLRHVLRMLTERLPRYVVFSEAPGGWDVARGGQPMTRQSLKTLTNGLSPVGPVRLPAWNSQYPLPTRRWWVYVQVTWFSPVLFCAGLRG